MKDYSDSPFLWGVATSACQTEGHVENDMTDWESRGGFRQGDHDPRIGPAVDHWHRWRDDFKLLKDLGVNSYRFSLEWARIEPEPGRISHRALDQYAEMIDWLLEHGIQPMLTLHHFSHPRWFHERSPWHKPLSIHNFTFYADIVNRRLLDRVPLVVTINEPIVWLLAAYGDGRFPPGNRDLDQLMKALYNMLQAHSRTYDLIKKRNPNTRVGIAKNFIAFKALNQQSPADRQLMRMVRLFYNFMILDAFATNRLSYNFPFVLTYDRPIELKDKIDFWGINYYYRLHVRFRFNLQRPFEVLFMPRSESDQSDLGWEIYPAGLLKICRWLKKTGKPLYVTENGIAVDDDSRRTSFLRDHLQVIYRLRSYGYPLRGYYHWSLLDNYEWLEGTRARFGLYHVDYDDDLSRSLKHSGRFYREYITADLSNSVFPD